MVLYVSRHYSEQSRIPVRFGYICDTTEKIIAPRRYVNSVKWQYLVRMMSKWTIIHFYPFEDAHKCIFLEAIQVLLLSVLCNERGISVECRKENTQWEKECSLFHISASVFLLCYICLHNFIWLPKTSCTLLDCFPSVLCNICQPVQHLRFFALGNTGSPYADNSLSLQCLLFLVRFLSFPSLPYICI